MIRKRNSEKGRHRVKFDLLIHDLKVPLAVVEAGILTLLNKQDKFGSISKKQEKVLRRILRNTLVTRQLVDDTMEIGRSSEGIMTNSVFQLSELVEGCLIEIFDLTDWNMSEKIRNSSDYTTLKDLLPSKGIFLEIEEPLWGKELCLDGRKMTQILRNLLGNALKFCKSKVTLNIQEAQGNLIVQVEDDGDGIPSELHQKIFECYFQIDGEGEQHCVRGHGLGLAGVMVLIEDMGGEMLLKSDVGKGAVFSVKLPLARSS
jgi:signal transduction histidine kinase